MKALLAMLALLAACTAAPDPAAERPAYALAPVLSADGLRLPARVAVLRLSGGAATPVPAAEGVLWSGLRARISRRLGARFSLVPLVPGKAGDDPVPGWLAAARGAGASALLVHDLRVAVEDDALPAAWAGLPLFGGMVPGTVMTEAHGTARAWLLAVSDGGRLGGAEASMTDMPVAPLGVSGGDGERVAGLAHHALLQRLLPAVEEMIADAAVRDR